MSLTTSAKMPVTCCKESAMPTTVESHFARITRSLANATTGESTRTTPTGSTAQIHIFTRRSPMLVTVPFC